MRQNALFGACSEWCLCVCGTAIAVPEWPLGGHLAMSVSVRTSAEGERFRLDYLADACITHRCDDVGQQLLPALADGGFALALELVPGPFDRGFDLSGGVCHTNHSRNCWEPFFMCSKWCSTSGSALAGVTG